MDRHDVQGTLLEDDQNTLSETENGEQDDPGAYPVPFRVRDEIVPGCRLDSIPNGLRYWARDIERRDAPWYKAFVEADDRYEGFLSERRPLGEYIVTFGRHKGMKFRDLPPDYIHWAISPANAHCGWYKSFVTENTRHEAHMRPGKFRFPCGKHKGTPLEQVNQNEVWWYLHPHYSRCPWYEALLDANRRYLDEYFSRRSPGSVEIWFGTRYRGYRLDQVYQRHRFIAFCLDPQRQGAKYYLRFDDLVRRYEARLQEYRAEEHPREPRRPPHIEHPCGERVGHRDDDRGSADEDDEYEKGSFVCSDSDVGEGDQDDDHKVDDLVRQGDEISDVDEDHQDDDDEGDEGSDYLPVEEDDLVLQSADEFSEDENSMGKDHPDADDQEDMDDDTPLDEMERRLNADATRSDAKQVTDSEDEEDVRPASPRKRVNRRIESDDEPDSDDDLIALGREYRVPKPDEPRSSKRPRIGPDDRHKLRVPHSSQ